jgi:4-amino-4-deoxy-L-arabinose transferase-like glycosyltransferase
MINKVPLENDILHKNKNILTVLIFSFAIFVLFYNLGGHYLEDWDEAFYVVMSQTAIQNGNYLVLEYQNDIHWSKNPVPLYPMIASFKLFGVNEFSARLSSVLFGLGLLLQIFFIAKRYYGQWTALLAVLITITSTQFIFSHGLKTANVDGITLFFLIAAISSWLLIENPGYKIITTFACLAFAFLCKGPIIVIPVVVICLSLFIENPLKKTSVKSLFIGLSAAAVIVLPWYLYAYEVYGDIFIKKHILYNFIQRYTEGIEGHKEGALYFIRYLFSTDHFIWTGVAMASLVYFLRIFLTKKRLIEFILPAWVLVTFIIVNLSQTKLWWYMFPIYPALAIITAKTLTDFVESPGFLNGAAYSIGIITMTVSIFGYHPYIFYKLDDLTIFGYHPYIFHKLFFDFFDINKTKIAALSAFLVFIGTVFFLKKYIPDYRKKFRILLVCIICIIPISKTYELTIKKDLNAPVSSLVKNLDFSKPVCTFTIGPDIFPPGAYYYLSAKGKVEQCSVVRLGKALKGKTVIMQTQTLEYLRKNNEAGAFQLVSKRDTFNMTPIENSKGLSKKNGAGTLQLVYKGDTFNLTQMENYKGFSIVKIE